MSGISALIFFLGSRIEVQRSDIILDHPVFYPFSKREYSDPSNNKQTLCNSSTVLLKMELQATALCRNK
jgi:hypothetical protein